MTVIAIAGEKVAEVSPKSRDHRIKFRRTSTNDIMAATYDPIKWVVPGYISEGFFGSCRPPKAREDVACD